MLASNARRSQPDPRESPAQEGQEVRGDAGPAGVAAHGRHRRVLAVSPDDLGRTSGPHRFHALTLVVCVHSSVTTPACYQRAIDRKRRPEGDEEPDPEAPPEAEVAEARLHRTGYQQDE